MLIPVDPAAKTGAAVGSAANFVGLLAGVEIEAAPLALRMRFPRASWSGMAGRRRQGLADCRAGLPLRSAVRIGADRRRPDPSAPTSSRAPNWQRLVETYPKSTIFLASGVVVHEAGGTAAGTRRRRRRRGRLRQGAGRGGAAMAEARRGSCSGSAADATPSSGRQAARRAAVWAPDRRASGRARRRGSRRARPAGCSPAPSPGPT